MKKIYTMCVLTLIISFILTSTALAAAHPWASFNQGSWVEIKSTTVTETHGKRETNIVVTKTTLLEKMADKVVLENEMTVKGQTTKTKFDLTVKDYSDAVSEGITVLKTGSETITIAGKSVTCETMQASMNLGGAKILIMRWISKQVPGSLVKSVTSNKSSQTTAEVVDFKAY